MNKTIFTRIAALLLPLAMPPAASLAQPGGAPLDPGPWVFNTFRQDNVGVSVLARELDHPFGLVFVPGTAPEATGIGDILLTERTGKIRLFRDGRLQEDAVVDLAEIFPLQQLFDIKLHPDFSQNGLIYFTYIKQLPHPDGSARFWATTALVRGHWDGSNLLGLEEIFEVNGWSADICGASSRLHFLEDRTLLLGASHRCDLEAPQSLASGIGKIMRLNDDGTIPRDNPFIGVEGALPELYTWGNRSVMDFVTHPVTGEIWELENGPQGGDEVNILKPGGNYGWPLATFGRDYDGTRFGPQPWVEGSELPELFWVPSITVGGLAFYTGDRFPAWKNSLFVTAMLQGRIPGTGHLQRITFNENGEQMREQMLNELGQRIRYVQQGPDGLIYLLVDHDDGAMLRLEPLNQAQADSIRAANGIFVSAPAAQDAVNSLPEFEGQDCRACHRTEGNLVGPSYRDISRRYVSNTSNIELLASKIIAGGEGNWGDLPMSAHPTLAESTARAMARHILDLQ